MFMSTREFLCEVHCSINENVCSWDKCPCVVFCALRKRLFFHTSLGNITDQFSVSYLLLESPKKFTVMWTFFFSRLQIWSQSYSQHWTVRVHARTSEWCRSKGLSPREEWTARSERFGLCCATWVTCSSGSEIEFSKLTLVLIKDWNVTVYYLRYRVQPILFWNRRAK